jgi:hypothetical protein
MKKGMKQTILIRIISTTFVVGALAVFKPFGLDAWQWQAYVHLAAMWVMGFSVCMITDLILKYVVKMPRLYDKGVEYIIRRNLWFQCINTPLIAVCICLYRHFVMSDRVESNHLSLVNLLETLVIIAFCSFAIGLYWRFKFRSKFLEVELEETRLLNEQLKVRPQPAPKGGDIILTGTTNESVSLQISNLMYIEAVGNYVKVCHLSDGEVHTDMLRSTSKQVEETLRTYPTVVRCHRAFLVNLSQVEQIVSKSGSMQLVMRHCHESLPVSRSNVPTIKEAIKGL